MIPRAVSYTHLDVYKRQIPMMARMVNVKDMTARRITASFHMAGFIIPRLFPFSPANSPTEYFSARMVVISMGTVSYTHLDVYKRQAWM